MSGFGMFEANITSDAEEKRHVREAANQLAAATYDVRERFGKFLFGSKDLTEYNDRLALSKNDILKTIEPHVFPRTGTVRRVLKPLEDEFKSRQGRTAMRRQAAPGDDDIPGPKPNRTVPMPPSGGRSTELNSEMSMSEAVNLGDKGALARGEQPQNSVPATGGAGMNTINAPASSAPPSPPKPPTSPTGAGAPAAAGNSGGGSAASDGGGSGWSPNNSTDSIGAGNYDIQSGDTLTTISERAGLGADGVASLAEANGIANPDMIYAGDSLTIPGGSDSSTGSTGPGLDTSAPTSAPSAPLAAEVGDPGSVGGTSGAPTDGLAADAAAGRVGRRAASRRRYADFEGELKPEGDWKGYLSDVDEGDEGRTTNNFGGTFPGGTDHNGDPADTDFVKSSTRHFALWCKANRRLANLDSLESYGPSDREYVAIAAMMQRVAKPVGPEWNSKGKPKINKPTKPGAMELHEAPEPDAGFSDSPSYGTPRAAGKHDSPFQDFYDKANPNAADNWDESGSPYSHAIPELERSEYFQEPPMMKKVKGRNPNGVGKHRAEAGKHDTPYRTDATDSWYQVTDLAYPPEMSHGEPAYSSERPMMKRVKGQPAKHRAPQHRPNSHQYPNTLNSLYEGGEPLDETKIEFFRDRSGRRRRTAAPDYLQKADEALTNLLNQKAEEFQGQIAPLQQALQTVQQAEQAAAAANPMNVMPPAGTVNVLPGGDPSGGAGGAGGGGLDPNALAAMMGGGDPGAGGGDPMMGGDPNAMGGADPSMGAPPGLDPNAMGGAPPAAQDQGLPPMMAARLRFARLHQAKNCECWDGYCRVPGTKPCSEGSCEKCDTHRKESRRHTALGQNTDSWFGGGYDPGPAEPGRARKEWQKRNQQDYYDENGHVRNPEASTPKESRRRQAKNVEQMWQEYTEKATQRGGEPDVEAFAQQYRVGPIALKRIRQKISADNRKRGGQGKGRRASAHTSNRRQAWSGWGGASLSMKRVAGWDFDHRLNGYITAAADTFSCDCGENFSTPSGYRKCGSCGRAWNSYVIGTDGHGKEAALEKVICREIPVRKDVIVASRRKAAGDKPFEDTELSPGMWRGIHHHYPYPDRIPEIYDYEQFRTDNPDWFHPDGSPNPPPMVDSNPWSMSSRKMAPPMNWSPRSQYQAPDQHPQYGMNDLYRRLNEDEIKQHWPEIPREKWTGYPGAVKYRGGKYHEPTMYSSSFPAEPGLYKVHAPGWETGMPAEKPKPTAMPKRVKGRPVNDPSSAEAGLTIAKRRTADKHTLRRIDLRDMMDQEPEEDKPEIEHFAARRVAAGDMSYEDTMAHIDKTLAEGERTRGAMECVGCGGQAMPPCEDWAMSRGHTIEGYPMPLEQRYQFYWDRGDMAPEEYGEVPSHWGPFGNWSEPSGFCENCHPNSPQAKWKQARRNATRRRAAGDWNRNPDKDWPQDDGDWGGLSKKKKKSFDGPDDGPLFGFNSLGTDGPQPKGPSPRYYAARSYVAQCRRARRRPTPEGLRRFMMAEHFDITEEGGTPKGKGKPSKKTTMSTPDAQWYRRNRGGRYT